MQKNNARQLLTLVVILLFYISMTACGEEIHLTAYDYYNSLPASPNEEQVEKLCAKFLAEVSWSLPSPDEPREERKAKGSFADIEIKSMDPEFLISEGKVKREKGDVKYEECYEFVYPPSLKAQLLLYCYYSTAFSLPTETDERKNLRMFMLLKALKITAERGSLTSGMLYQLPSSAYYRKLYEKIVKCGVLEEFDRIGEEESKKLDFGIGTKWDQFVLWQQSANCLTRDDYGIPYLSHWIWLKDNFGPVDIFVNPLPEVIPSDELLSNCKLNLFLDHFINPKFLSSNSLLEGNMIANTAGIIEMSVAGYYMYASIMNGDDSKLERYDIMKKIYFPWAADSAVCRYRHSKIYRFLNNLDDPVESESFDRIKDLRLNGRYSFEKIAEGDTGRTTFCGMRQFEGKGHETIESDRIIPHFYVVPGNSELSFSNYISDLKDVRTTGVLLGSSRFFTWNYFVCVNDYGWSQVDYHYPLNKIGLELDYDFTPEALQQIARSDAMKRYMKKIGRYILKPELYVETDFVPVVLYTFEDCKYEIWQPFERNLSYSDILLERPYCMIVLYPDEDAMPISAEPALLYKPLKYWFRRGWYNSIYAVPYFMQEKFENPDFAPVVEKAKELAKQYGDQYKAKFLEYLAKVRQRKQEDPLLVSNRKQ